MNPNGISTQHVKQVAALVQRLTPEEIRELLRLVPELQAEALAISQPDDDLVHWVHEQLAQYSAEAQPMKPEDKFLGDKSVADYFALPESEREHIWAELYTAQ